MTERTLELRKDGSLGSRTFGKVMVDCSFLCEGSLLGNLGQKSAGLLRLKLIFHEPEGFKLSSAEINLSFLQSSAGSLPSVTQHVYPDLLCGPLLSQQHSGDVHLEPEVNAGNFGTISGLGYQSHKDRTENVRWHLKGNRLPDAEHSYTKVGWIWQANPLNEQNEINRGFHLAIVVEDMGAENALRTQLEIGGKLKQLRSGWPKFQLRAPIKRPTVKISLLQESNEFPKVIKELSAKIRSLNATSIQGKPAAPRGLINHVYSTLTRFLHRMTHIVTVGHLKVIHQSAFEESYALNQ